jgi:hypothetical protein
MSTFYPSIVAILELLPALALLENQADGYTRCSLELVETKHELTETNEE